MALQLFGHSDAVRPVHEAARGNRENFVAIQAIGVERRVNIARQCDCGVDGFANAHLADPSLPDLIVCRPELADAILQWTRSNIHEVTTR